MGDTDRGAAAGGTPLDLVAVGGWLGAPVEDEGPVHAGGSKISRRVRVGGRSAVIAVGPGNALPTAHDLRREHACLQGLAGSDVPVPEVLGYCADPAVAGAAFLVTAMAPGSCLLWEPDAPVDAPALAAAAVDVLAAVHAAAIPAGLPAPPGSYLERQVRRWGTQLAATPTSGRLDDWTPLFGWLLRHLPSGEARTLVHGDYGFHNLLVDGADITAVLDWELAAVGDPVADLVGLTRSWGRDGLAANPANDAVANRPGVMTRHDLEDRYEARTGRSPGAHQPFYDVFSLWRSIGIREGLHARSGGTRFVDDAPSLLLTARRLAGID